MKKRSPIKDKPLRTPAQSLQERREEILNDKLLMLVVVMTFFIMLTGYEWWFYFNPAPRNPILYTAMTILFSTYAGFRIWHSFPELRRLKLGIEGEKAVGQFLDRLREQGYQVFHDLQGEDFNIDHLIIGRAGIFTIETKTLSKPLRGSSTIQFDGNFLKANGRLLERNPITQAKAQSRWVWQLLEELTAKRYKVKPVVVFPGWYIETSPNAYKDVWVLEPKALVKFLEYEPEVFTAEEAKILSNHLSRYIRLQEKNR